MKTILLKVEYKDHDKVVLTNPNGDTYTSTSEDLMDFLHGAKDVEYRNQEPKGTVYVPVKCSERLPKEQSQYFICSKGLLMASDWDGRNFYDIDNFDIEFWLEETTLPIEDTQSACKHDYVKTGLEGELYCYKCDSHLPIADIAGEKGQKEADWELMTMQIIDVLEEANGTGSGAYDVIEFLKSQSLPSNEKQYSREDIEKAWDSGWQYGHADGAGIMEFTNPQTKEQFIQSLNQSTK